MRTSLFIALGIVTLLGLLSGCVVTEKVYLTDVDAASQVALPPVIPTMEKPAAGAVTLLPHFGVNIEEKVIGRVDPVGTAPPRWGGSDNLTWRIPRGEGGLDVQVSVGPAVAILVGGTIGMVDGSTYGGFRGGLGIFTVSEKTALRLDGGVQLLSASTRVRATVETRINSIFGNSVYRSNFDDTRDYTSFTPYAGLTLNTISQTSPINLVLNVGVSGQPLFNLTPAQHDTILGPGDMTSLADRIRETIAVYSITPALSVELGGGNQLLVGARLFGSFSVENASPGILWRPFVQAVMRF